MNTKMIIFGSKCTPIGHKQFFTQPRRYVHVRSTKLKCYGSLISLHLNIGIISNTIIYDGYKILSFSAPYFLFYNQGREIYKPI